MKSLSSIPRIWHIHAILIRYQLDDIFSTNNNFKPLRIARLMHPIAWMRQKKAPLSTRIRLALEELGPLFIKFGQILSTRRDLIPNDIANELCKLQDQVPAFSGDIAKQIIEKTFNDNIDSIFKNFDIEALASASIAQVHKAVLHSGEDVIVKVLRPKIQKKVQRDLDVLYSLANIAERFWSQATHAKPKALVDEIANMLHHELDLSKEAANASQLRHNAKSHKNLYIPEIYWQYCKKNILVTEFVHGIDIDDINALREANVDLKLLAEQSLNSFFTQVFQDSFFHADMHPGNIFVNNSSGETQLILVDFGIVGSLSSADQHYLAGNMLAFFKRDYRRVAELHIMSGWLPTDTRVDQFENAIRAVCEPIFEKSLKDISFGQLLLGLIQTARQFSINIQPQLILLQKTLLNIEGIVRQLNPDLDLWETAKPFLENWVKQQTGPKATLCKIRNSIPQWADKLPEIPELFYQFLTQPQQAIKTTPKRSMIKTLTLGLGLAFLTSFLVTYGVGHSPKIVNEILAILGVGLIVISSFFPEKN